MRNTRLPIRPFALLLTFALVVFSVYGDELRLLPASTEVKERAAARVLAAVTAHDPGALEEILKAPVLCGPRLWQRLKGSMPNDKNKVGTAMLIFDPGSGGKSWGIEALDLSGVSTESRNVIEQLLKEHRERIPVETGRFFQGGVELLAAALRERFLRGAVTVSPASSEDIHYYWLMVPYDIEEPVLRLDTSEGSLLLDVGKLTFIDLLPEDVVQADRRDKSSHQSPD